MKTTDLTALSDPQLSALFAAEVAGWIDVHWSEDMEENRGNPPHDVESFVYYKVPEFSTSLDALRPYMEAHKAHRALDIKSHHDSWEVLVGSVPMAKGESLSRCIAIALILWHRSQKGGV